MEQAIGTAQWLRMMGSLVLVLVLLVACLWLWRWLQNRGTGWRTRGQAQLQVQEVVQLGVRHKIIMLRAGPRQLVVGVSPSGMTALAQWPRFGEELQQAQDAAQAPESRS